jgi:MFS family permease
MVIEILGTRVIGPVFGVGLFVWSALLAVTLASLATGYYLGGVLIDRTPSRRLLGLMVLIGGVLLGLTPLVRRTILLWSDGLGPRAGSLLSATLLFGPSLVALGTVGPVVVRLATEDFRATGRRVGTAYAISTAGSLIGTLVTGFLLVPTLETNHILLGTALVLILLGGVPLALRRRPAGLLALLVPALALGAPRPKLPDGIQVLARAQSLYGLIEVIDDQNRGVRLLRADHSIIGAQYNLDHSAAFDFLHLLESVRYIRPGARDMLQLGLGVGSLPTALRSAGMRTDVVEIDPQVVRFAQEHFGFSPAGDVLTEDARTYLQRTRRTYDIIVHDTFTGGSAPEHILSLEVVQRIRSILRPGGVLALNFPGYESGPRTEGSFAVFRTLRAVFPVVRAFRDGPPDTRDAVANLVFFASDSPMDFTIPAQAKFENDACQSVLRGFQNWETLRRVPPGRVVTDEWNPLARLQLPSAEEHFRAMNELLPLQVWIE